MITVLQRMILGATVANGLAFSASWTAMNTGLPLARVGVRTLVVDASSSSTIYALGTGAPWGGWGSLFKTTDGGETWKIVNGISAVGGLVIDPSNSSTLYGIARGLVVKSLDGGQSWTGASAGLVEAYALAIDPRSTSTLYATAYVGYGLGLFKTTNGGASWSRKPTPPMCCDEQFLIDPSDSSTIYVIGNGSLFKSTDGGESWRSPVLLPGSNNRLLAIDPASPSTLYTSNFMLSPSGPPSWSLYRSTDGGQTWTPVNNGIPAGAYVTSLVIDPTADTIYASYVVGDPTGGVIKSTDGGASWITVNTGLPSNTPPINSLALDPANRTTIVAGYFDLNSGRGGVFKTTDGAKNWNDASAGLTVFDVHALAMDPVDRATVYSTVGDRLAKASNGVEWNTLVQFPASSSGPGAATSFLIDPRNPNILYAAVGAFCVGHRWLRKSTDGGVTWSELTLGSFCGFGADLAFDANDSNTIYASAPDPDDCGSPFERTSDGGTTWSMTLLDDRVGALVSAPGEQTTLYGGTWRGVTKSTDGGRTWLNTGLTAGTVSVLALDPRDPNILYAGIDQDWFHDATLGLFKTTDGGATWSVMNNGLEGVVSVRTPFTALVIDPSLSVLYMGTSGSGVFKSVDGGASWATFNDGLPNLDIRALAVSSDGSGVVYAGTPAGVFRVVDKQ